ncbi:hypothetical protein ASD65_15130 [Microbacterium sp. Root61]|nr:hypothetical protein ASD65_15130 [Microbacterium sp. Root61]
MLAMLLIFTGCTPAPAPRPSPTVALSTPEPSPTAEALVVAPGDKPPQVFGGDCHAAISEEALSEVTGIAGIELTQRDPTWTSSIDNVGGLACEWVGGDVSGSFQVLPRQMLGDTVFSVWEQSHIGECEWGCSWIEETDSLWIGGYATDLPERGRAEADRMAAEISALIVGRAAASDLAWERDTSGWWPVVDCNSVAVAIGQRLNATLSATSAGYHDPPLQATRAGDFASNRTWCSLEESGQTIALGILESGMAWNVPWAGLGEPHDLGVAGITSFLMESSGYLGGTNYEMTDGVNALSVEAALDTRWTTEQIAAAFADFAGSGLR